jgi:transcription termination factor Rho
MPVGKRKVKLKSDSDSLNGNGYSENNSENGGDAPKLFEETQGHYNPPAEKNSVSDDDEMDDIPKNKPNPEDDVYVGTPEDEIALSSQKKPHRHETHIPGLPSEAEAKEIIEKVFPGDNKLSINELKKLSIVGLSIVAMHLKLDNYESMHTQELIYSILRKHADNGGVIYGGGTLQVLENGFGFLRSQRYNYLSSPDDIYVSPSQISLFRLRTGDHVEGQIRPPKKTEEEKFFALLRIELINDLSTDESRKRTLFDNLTPLFPDEAIKLESEPEEVAMRMMDLFTPIGLGQRGLIVSPPKAGKTVLLKKIANSITRNMPDVKLIIFLVDERPEEVTDMQRSVKAEVVSSTFDEPAVKHVAVANMVHEKAKRLVECGYDVVILLDSITRLARAYNTCEPPSGRVLSGGLDANALHKPKKFFGAARNIEEGGSLTIIATALIDTGSKMDEVIYEEFKGTGNMEIHLDRNLSNIRVYPALDLKLSGTRREDLLQSVEVLEKARMLRRIFADMSNEEVIGKLKQALTKTATNQEFLSNMQYFAK